MILIKNAKIVNDGSIFEGDVLIENEFNIDIETNEFIENTTVSGLIGLIGSKI